MKSTNNCYFYSFVNDFYCKHGCKSNRIKQNLFTALIEDVRKVELLSELTSEHSRSTEINDKTVWIIHIISTWRNSRHTAELTNDITMAMSKQQRLRAAVAEPQSFESLRGFWVRGTLRCEDIILEIGLRSQISIFYFEYPQLNFNKTWYF